MVEFSAFYGIHEIIIYNIAFPIVFLSISWKSTI